MTTSDLQKQTNVNIQEKANLIWETATHLVGLFKPHEYGKVILPMTVLKRFDDALRPTKVAVVAMAKKLDEQKLKDRLVTVFFARPLAIPFTTPQPLILPS